MAFMQLTGLDIPVRDGSATCKLVEVAPGRGRSPRGIYVAGTRSPLAPELVKREWTVTTEPISTAESLYRWVMGRKMFRVAYGTGRLTSDNGVAPEHDPAFGGAPLYYYPWGITKHGASRAVYLEAPSVYYRIPYLGSGPSSAAWIYWLDAPTPQWVHYARVGSQAYINGDPYAGAMDYLTYTGAYSATEAWAKIRVNPVAAAPPGVMHGNEGIMQELVMASWAWTDEMVAALYAQGGTANRACPEFPTLELRGDALREAPALPSASPADVALVRCVAMREGLLQGVTAGVEGWENNLRTLTFTLREL